MKMKKVMVTFEKRMSMQVYAPEDMTNDQIKDIAEGLASEGLREWDDPDWSAYVGKLEDVNVSDDELKSSPPNRWGFKTCQSPTLKKGLVISDDRQDIVNADDADWWVVT